MDSIVLKNQVSLTGDKPDTLISEKQDVMLSQVGLRDDAVNFSQCLLR